MSVQLDIRSRINFSYVHFGLIQNLPLPEGSRIKGTSLPTEAELPSAKAGL
jgi:hypothetical protein